MKKILTVLTITFLATTFAFAGGNKEDSSDSMMKMEPTDTHGDGDTMMKADNDMENDDSMMKADNDMENDDSMMKADNDMENDDSMMKADASMMKPPFDLKGLGPRIVAFESEEQAQTLAKTKTVIYYFAASWCPTCQATYRSLKTDYKKIPEDTVLVVVNYDLADKLKTQYGITYQHTFVVIDDKGNKKAIWTGTDTVKKILNKSMAETAM